MGTENFRLGTKICQGPLLPPLSRILSGVHGSATTLQGPGVQPTRRHSASGMVGFGRHTVFVSVSPRTGQLVWFTTLFWLLAVLRGISSGMHFAEIAKIAEISCQVPIKPSTRLIPGFSNKLRASQCKLHSTICLVTHWLHPLRQLLLAPVTLLPVQDSSFMVNQLSALTPLLCMSSSVHLWFTCFAFSTTLGRGFPRAATTM